MKPIATFALCAALTLAPQLACAGSAVMSRQEELREQPATDASVIMTVNRLATVEVLEERRGWFRIEAPGNRRGWVRDSSLRLDGSPATMPPSPVDGLPSGRQAGGKLAMATAVRAVPRASNHALIMTISQYGDPAVPPLAGVRHDVDSAVKMAHLMGVPDANIRFLSDGQLTLEGFRQAFADLDGRIGENDRVFIYYSGHGTRQVDTSTPGGGCIESLLTYERYAFSSSEMTLNLQALAKKADKVVVVVDACHSAGVARMRSIGSSGGITPKFAELPGQAAQCQAVSNVFTRAVTAGQKKPGSGAQNFVYVAAAREDEVSLDDPTAGGFATQSLLRCLSGEVPAGSGRIPNVGDLQQCAQAQIDARLVGNTQYKPHHISVTGNREFIPSLLAGNGPAESTQVNPRRILEALNAQRDDRRVVKVTSARNSYRIGKDELAFTVSSSHPGYLYVLMVDTEGRNFDMLFPNQLDRNNQIEADTPVKLPGKAWAMEAGGPQGSDTLLFIVSDSPRDFARAGLTASGPFSSAPGTGRAAQDISLVTLAADTSTDCVRSETRNQGPAQARRCSTSYGAALLEVREEP